MRCTFPYKLKSLGTFHILISVGIDLRRNMSIIETGDPEKVWDDLVGILGLRTQLGGDGTAIFEFVAFWINPFVDAALQVAQLTRVLEQFQLFFAPFKGYPFLSEPMKPRIEYHEGIPYIYGYQEVPGSIDEPLLRGLVWRFLCQFQDLWVHFLDDDYYLCERPELVPKWLSPKLSGNRLWINWERALVIPSDVCSGISLTLLEAVEYIKKFPYKLEILAGLEIIFELETVELAIGNIDDRTVKLPPHIAPLMVNRPWLFCRCAWEAVDGLTENQDDAVLVDDLRDVIIVLPSWMKEFKDIERLCFNGWDNLKRKYPRLKQLEHDDYKRVDDDAMDREYLMKKLVESGHLKLNVAPRPFNVPDETSLREEIVTERLKTMFEQHEAEEFKSEEDGEEDEEQLDSAKDEEIIAQFASEGVLIDEDDFFEYFLRNALHIDEGKLEEYRKTEVTEEEGRFDGLETKTYNDDSEYDSDGEEFEVEDQRGRI